MIRIIRFAKPVAIAKSHIHNSKGSDRTVFTFVPVQSKIMVLAAPRKNEALRRWKNRDKALNL